MNLSTLTSSKWPKVRFGDVVRNVDESVRDPQNCGLERYVGLEHIDPESLHIQRWGLIAEGTTFTRRFRKGQVLFGKRRAYQRKVAVAEFDGLCSSDILVFEPKDESLLPELLPFLCQTESFFEHALDTSAGSLSPRTKFKELARFELPLPPLNEQHQIAEILWAIDNFNTRLTNSVLASNEVLASIRTNLILNPAHRREKLGTYLLDIIAGKSLIGVNQPIREQQFGVVKVSAVGEEHFLPEENKTLVNQDDYIEAYSIKSGDVLITRANTTELVGKICVVENNYPQLMLSDKTLKLLIDDKKMLPEFVVEALRTQEARRQIEYSAKGTGGAMKNISQAEIREFVIPCPSLSEQVSIMEKIKGLRKFKNRIHEHIQNSNVLKRAIQDKYLSWKNHQEV